MLKQVRFSEVLLGGWFKETADGVWHLKTSATTGSYQSWSTRYEPKFEPAELVWVQ